MRRLIRIVVIVAVTVAVIAVAAYWVAPVAVSIDAARKAPKSTRVVPADLQDLSISQAPGTKLSYFGYGFEIPWIDIDDTKTKLSANTVILTFRSGLRLMIGAGPAKRWVNRFASDSHSSAEAIESVFGLEPTQSDYNFVKLLYEFTPDKMHLWALSPRTHVRETLLLTIKSVGLSPSADEGIFNIHNQQYRGFQEGSPQARSTIILGLFSDAGSIHFTIFQKNYPAGVSQAEINRIVQSLHTVPQDASRATTKAGP